MPQPNLKRSLLLRAAALLALFGLGLVLSSQALWLGWALSLAALIASSASGAASGETATARLSWFLLGALVLGASFAGLMAVWGLAFGIGGDSDGETIGWFLLVRAWAASPCWPAPACGASGGSPAPWSWPVDSPALPSASRRLRTHGRRHGDNVVWRGAGAEARRRGVALGRIQGIPHPLPHML